MPGTEMLSKRGFSRAALCVPALIVVAAMVGAVWAPAPCRADAAIWIKTSSPRSVTGQDDLAQFKYLASGVGWEFEPTAETAADLKRVGIQTIRCINVEPMTGHFDTDGKFILEQANSRLDWHLDACRTVGAVPHVVIANAFPDALRVKPEDVTDPAFKKLVSEGEYGPTDWAKYRSYCEVYFEYVMVTKCFTNAEFEVGNEPEGGALLPMPPRPSPGSRAMYEAYFNQYKNIAEAAVDFEQAHPGLHVTLGGPALAGPFTFRFGDFNWGPRFVRDCAEQHVQLDFFSWHSYGNHSSLDGEYSAIYPSFTGQMREYQAAIDKYSPGLPTEITEWGPNYNTGTTDLSAANADNVGAAWGAAFLNTMLSCGVRKALFLVTTDLRQQESGQWVDNWGWDSLFLDPAVFGGKSYPKPIFHLFEMVSRLEGHRVEATRGGGTVNCFVSADPEQRKVTMLVWNFGAVFPEGGVYQEKAVAEKTQIRVRDAGDFFHSPQVRVEAWQINGDTDNLYKLLTTGVAPDENNTAMAQLPAATAKIDQGALNYQMVLPPSSVSLVVLTPAS